MKKFFIYAVMAMLAIAGTGCKKMAEKMLENASNSMMGSYVEELRKYPYSIEKCDSVMKSHLFAAEKLKDLGVTTWTHPDTGGEITRYKSQNEVIGIDLIAKTKFDSYSKTAARMWLQSMEKIMDGYTKSISCRYDEKELDSFKAIYDMMDNEPATYVSVRATNNSTEASFTIMAGSNPKSFTYTLTIKDLNIRLPK